MVCQLYWLPCSVAFKMLPDQPSWPIELETLQPKFHSLINLTSARAICNALAGQLSTGVAAIEPEIFIGHCR